MEETKNKSGSSENQPIREITCWIFGGLFLIIGILNLVLVHPVPGIFYLLFALIYCPFANGFLKRKTGYKIPFFVKIVAGFVILWGTLAVGDLAEILGL